MSEKRLARFIARATMVVGLGVGVLAIAVWNFGLRIQVPEWMWRVAMVKIGLATALGLIGAGALLLRGLKRSERAGALDEAQPDEQPRALAAHRWEPTTPPRERELARLTTPPETPVP